MNILKKLSKDSRGFGHIEMIVIVLVVAAIAASGFFVYQHQKKHTTAHAGSWASYSVNSQVCVNWGDWGGGSNCPGGSGDYNGRINATLWACRQYINVFGGINQVHAHFMSSPFYYNGTDEGTYTGPFGIIPDNQARQGGTVWHPFAQNGRTSYNSQDFTINFPAWQWHNFYAVLNDGSQQVHINVNFLPQC